MKIVDVTVRRFRYRSRTVRDSEGHGHPGPEHDAIQSLLTIVADDGVEGYAFGGVDEEVIAKLIAKHFDLRPGAIIRDLRLRRPIYRPTAAYGHFGRDDIDAPWEVTDKADILREEAGLSTAASR